jgi:hypothetical protein
MFILEISCLKHSEFDKTYISGKENHALRVL